MAIEPTPINLARAISELLPLALSHKDTLTGSAQIDRASLAELAIMRAQNVLQDYERQHGKLTLADFTPEPAPRLSIDVTLGWTRRPLSEATQRHENEKWLLWNLIRFLGTKGFMPVGLHDGDERTIPTSDMELQLMELAFNLDECWITFRHPKHRKQHVVYFIWDNGDAGRTAISDWGFTDGDPDGFNAAMDAYLDLLEEPDFWQGVPAGARE